MALLDLDLDHVAVFFSTYIYGDLKFHQRVQVTGIVSNIKSLL